jgi:uncharacterized protein
MFSADRWRAASATLRPAFRHHQRRNSGSAAGPVTPPAALPYVQQGTRLPWVTIVALIVGLWVGTGIGARFAKMVSPSRLRVMLMVVIASMAIFMAWS